jgi:hypothetical protein
MMQGEEIGLQLVVKGDLAEGPKMGQELGGIWGGGDREETRGTGTGREAVV